MKQNDYSPLIGSPELQFITESIAPVKRVVVTAANRAVLSNGKVVLLVGARHCDTVMQAQAEALGVIEDGAKWGSEQGFIDQWGQYMTREEAYYIAHKNKQPLIGEDWGVLYSENLH